ncbi:alpha/beta hydrolase [Fulvivirga sp. RKSG066]|uniref:alpha/beta hydrolase family protein n=1 Tax=Fulvivirga aurantia TaxID=2529383 RepID=UPI0012BCFD44|nr:alpha/beta hydrolase [Fulvivirga aurantia]MTI20340.1 alpha/beta hydrolase [Fulvivirga aurantia]
MTNSLKIIDDIVLHSDHHNKPMLVDARFVASTYAKPVVIFVHGFKGFKDWGHWNIIANEMAYNGFCVVKPNLSHNGTTPEKPLDFDDLEAFSNNTYSIELDDLGTLIDYLFSTTCTIPNLDLSKVYLVGHSRGGGLTLLKAHEDDRIKGVITWASVADYGTRWDEETMEKWKATGTHHIYNGRTKQNMPMKYNIVEDYHDNIDRLNIRKAVESLKVPLLHIHGDQDPTINIEEAKEMSTWNKQSELYIVEGADHVFNGSHPFEGKELPENSQILIDKTLSFLRQISGNS